MLQYVTPAHSILTVVLFLLYLFLAYRFFNKKNGEVTGADRLLAQIARYSLLLIYVTGILMYVSMGIVVSRVHLVVSLLPAILMVGIRYIPSIAGEKNKMKVYGWVLLVLGFLMIVMGLTSRISVLPTF